MQTTDTATLTPICIDTARNVWTIAELPKCSRCQSLVAGFDGLCADCRPTAGDLA